MKKNIVIISVSILIILSFIYLICLFMGKFVEYEVLSIEEAPKFIQDNIQVVDKSRFRILHDENKTYIYYKSDHVLNEYITTDLDLKIMGGNYVATGTVEYAVNDGKVSYDSLIKFDKILDQEIILKEIDKR